MGDEKKKESWQCLLTGKICTVSGSVRRVNRWFDGAGDLRGAALRALALRKDRGAPWRGDALTAVTPLGQRIEIIVPVEFPRVK